MFGSSIASTIYFLYTSSDKTGVNGVYQTAPGDDGSLELCNDGAELTACKSQSLLRAMTHSLGLLM